MKVLVVRVATASILVFLTVFCIIYAMGSFSVNGNRQKTIGLPENTAEILLAAAKAERAEKLTRVADADWPRQAYVPPQPQPQPSVVGPDKSWFQGTKAERSRFEPLLRSRRAPAFQVNQWTNTKPLHPAAREGKIIVLTFWSTWCQPCLNSIDFNNQLHQHYADQDVMVIGICNTDGSEDMAKIVKTRNIEYPVAIDDNGDKSVLAYEVQAIPTYFVIDREGRLRFADIKRGHLADAIEYLLSRE